MKSTWTTLAVAILIVPPLEAAPVLQYEGHLSVRGTNYTGLGRFLFAINGRNGSLWSTGTIPPSGSTADIAGSLVLNVTNGAYTTKLGEPGADSRSIPESAFADPEARLSVWFRDTKHGWRRIASEALPAPGPGLPSSDSGAPLAAQVDLVLRELKDIHKDIHALEKAGSVKGAADHPAEAPRAEIVSLPLNDSPTLGSANAPVVLVEFTDFQCGFCRQFHETVFPQLVKDYVEPGKLRIISRNLTLPFHAQAEPAARAALCGRDQGKFWAMREQLFARTASLSTASIEQAATESGLDLPAFRICLTGNPAIGEQIKRDGQQAQALGIEGTPTFILGTVSNGQITGLKIVGARPYAAFEAEVKKALAAAAKKGST